MAQSGNFKLMIADEKTDKYFTAWNYLKKRLVNIKRSGKSPTISDIRRTHIYYLNSHYKPYVDMSSAYVKVKSSGSKTELNSSQNTFNFKFLPYGNFTSDMVLRVKFDNLGTSSSTTSSPKYRFCAKPGIRLLSRVAFKSNSVTLSEYTADDMLFVDKFDISEDKRHAWDESMGHATEKTAEYYNKNGFTGVYHYKDGLQTPKFLHENVELWIPLNLFMCGDPANALYNKKISNSQREIDITFEKLDRIIQAHDQNTNAIINLPISSLNFTAELYINNLFINQEIDDIVNNATKFSLIRVPRRQKVNLITNSDTIKLDQLKYPAEYIRVGFRDLNNIDDFDNWHLFGRTRVRNNTTNILVPASHYNTTKTIKQVVVSTAKNTTTLDPVVSNFKLSCKGIDLFPEMSRQFYNLYMPQRYFNNTTIVSSKDNSAYMIPMCLFPGQDNPSGYHNLSSTRELQATYTSTQITSSSPAELIVSMSGLNFILMDGDKLKLKFSI